MKMAKKPCTWVAVLLTAFGFLTNTPAKTVAFLPMSLLIGPSELVARVFYSDLSHAYLTWQDNATDETGYELESANSLFAGTNFSPIATLPADSTLFVDAPAFSNFTALVLYRIRATNSVGYSAYSNIATAVLWTATNSWISPVDGTWQGAANWSLSQAPTNIHTLVITNAATKTVTIDSVTSGFYPETLTVSDVILSAPAGATNTLDLANAGTNLPLHVLHTVGISQGGWLRLTNSAVWVEALVGGGLSVDGDLVVGSNGLLVADGGLYAGLDSNGMGSVVLDGGLILMTNTLPSAIGVDGSAQMTIANRATLSPSGFHYLLIGTGGGSEGSVTVAGGDLTTLGRLAVGMEAGATGRLSVTDGRLGATNMMMTLVGGAGSGELNLSGGTNEFAVMTVAGDPGSQGTLTVAGGVNRVQRMLFVGASPGATGAVWMTGGQFIHTNRYSVSPRLGGGFDTASNSFLGGIGTWGVGTLTVSNGNWLGGRMLVGVESNSEGAVAVAGGTVTLYDKLAVGVCGGSAVGVVDVAGGSLYVTNVAHRAIVDVSAGTMTVSGGLVVIDELFVTNTCGFFQHTGGTLQVNNLILDPALSATGDGLPNLWKQAYGLDPLKSSVSNGPEGDPDGDGVPNLQEYSDGTDPTNATSALRILSVTAEGDDNRVTWTTIGNKTYLLQGTVVSGGSNVFIELTTIAMPDGGESVTNYLDVGAATNVPPRSYRVVLVPPTGLWVGFCQASAVPFNQVALGWSDDNSNEGGYKIERATSAGGPWRQIAQVLPNSASYRDSRVLPGTTYYYRVRAFNAPGDSPYSPVSSASIPALCPRSLVAWGCCVGFQGVALGPWFTNAVAIATSGSSLSDYRYLTLNSDGTVLEYGGTPPANLTGVVAVALSRYHSLAVKSDGTVVGWGNNTYGESTPPTNLTDAVAVAAIDFGSYALKSDGTVVGWGNVSGAALTNLTGVVAINRGNALRSDGTVFMVVSNPPPNLNLVGVISIADDLALQRDGTVVGFGLAIWLGEYYPPTSLTGVVGIASANTHGLALKSDGTVVGWRDQRGYGSFMPPPPNGLGGVIAIAAVGDANLALTTALAAPTGLSATAVSPNRINLGWTDNSSNEDLFRIDRATSSTGPWSEIGMVNSNVTSYLDTGATCGQTYFYRVRASGCSASPYSGVAGANTSTVDTDCDGIPNSWTQKYFGHPTGQAGDGSLATDDPDGDGLLNLQEYQAGTDPTSSGSTFRITSILPEGDDLLISWTAVTNKTYAVQVVTNSPDGDYTNTFGDLSIVVVPATPVITETNYLDVGALTNDWSRYYRIRLVTPP